MSFIQQAKPLPPRIRDQFPLLKRNPGLSYLDNAATTQKPRAVLDAIQQCYEQTYAAVHRGIFPLADSATEAYEQARARLAAFINAGSAKSVIFTSGATAALNLAALSWLRPKLKPGDRILVTEAEHHSNLIPWRLAAQASGAEVVYLPLSDQGDWPVHPPVELLKPPTRLFALTMQSNVSGSRPPLTAYLKAAREAGVAVALDAAQAAAHQPIDVAELDCDFLSFSAHKMYGPSGIGCLYVHPRRLTEMKPVISGGGAVSAVDQQGCRWREPPWCFEPGTPALAQAVGFAAAADWLSGLSFEAVHAHEKQLHERCLTMLSQTAGVKLHQPARSPSETIVCFTLDQIHPHDAAQLLGESGVALRAGHHCAHIFHQRLGLHASLRISLGVYNQFEDIERLQSGLTQLKEVFTL